MSELIFREGGLAETSASEQLDLEWRRPAKCLSKACRVHNQIGEGLIVVISVSSSVHDRSILTPHVSTMLSTRNVRAAAFFLVTI